MTIDGLARSSGPAGGSDGVSDADLAKRAAAGDRQAAGLLVERHQSLVRHFLRRLTGCDATADDLAQETFVRMLRNTHRYDARHPMRTWLLTIARRLSINHHRDNRRTVARHNGTPLATDEPDPGDLAAEREDGQRLRAALDEAIGQLTRSQREAVVLFHQQGLSVQEAAEVMGVPTNTVKSHLHRGRAALRRMLDDPAEKQE